MSKVLDLYAARKDAWDLATKDIVAELSNITQAVDKMVKYDSARFEIFWYDISIISDEILIAGLLKYIDGTIITDSEGDDIAITREKALLSAERIMVYLPIEYLEKSTDEVYEYIMAVTQSEDAEYSRQMADIIDASSGLTPEQADALKMFNATTQGKGSIN